MRRLSTAGAALVALAALLGVAGSSAAGAAPRQEPAADDATLSIVKVSGLLDPVLADFVTRSVDDAEAEGAIWVVLQLNSPGSVLSRDDLGALLDHVRNADVPVAVWVGPSGGRALGGAAQVAAVADAVGMAPGTRLGDMGAPAIDPQLFAPAYQEALPRLTDARVGASEAGDLGLTIGPAPIIGSFLIQLDGVETQVVQTDEGPRTAPATTPVFRALPIGSQLMHTVASPPVAYLLFVIGMALILFELYTAGVGVAGLVGAGSFVLGCYGLAVLPARWWAVALLVLSMLAFGIDVQTGVPRFWTGVGVVAFVTGSLFLYDGLSISWITLLIAIVGMVVFFLAGMPAMVRTRFSTPTIGRDWMVGEQGEVVADVAPDGVVQVRGALWRARTNRATPVTAGEPVRVVEVDGLLLEVEPLDGAAKDYRRR